jgi:hypothetical protein
LLNIAGLAIILVSSSRGSLFFISLITLQLFGVLPEVNQEVL